MKEAEAAYHPLRPCTSYGSVLMEEVLAGTLQSSSERLHRIRFCGLAFFGDTTSNSFVQALLSSLGGR